MSEIQSQSIYEVGAKVERAILYFSKAELEIMELCLRNQEQLEFADVMKEIHDNCPDDPKVKFAMTTERGNTESLEEIETSLITQEMRDSINSEAQERYKMILQVRKKITPIIKELA